MCRRGSNVVSVGCEMSKFEVPTTKTDLWTYSRLACRATASRFHRPAGREATDPAPNNPSTPVQASPC